MTLLEVRCYEWPLARVSVHDDRLHLVAQGTGFVTVDVEPGMYATSTEAGAGRVERLVKVGTDQPAPIDLGVELPTWTLPPADHVSAVEAIAGASRSLAADRSNESGIVLALWQAGADQVSWTPAEMSLVHAKGHGRRVSWHASPDRRGDVVTWAEAVPAGSYQLTISEPARTALTVPAWQGWQTLVVIPVVDAAAAPALASMICVPLHSPWAGPDRLTNLMVHLQRALGDRVAPAAEGLDQIAREAVVGGGADGVPPLMTLMLAHAAIDAAEPRIWRWNRGELAARADAAAVSNAELVALDVLADEAGMANRSSETHRTIRQCPLLSRSADALLRLEARHPGSVVRPAADAFAGRLASSTWFRWSTTSGADTTFAPSAWTAATATLLSRHVSVDELERLRRSAGDDPAVNRLLTYALDRHRVTGLPPAEAFAADTSSGESELSKLSELVTMTGLPAVTLTRSVATVNAIRRRRRLVRRGAIAAAAVAVVLVGVIAWYLLRPDDGSPNAVDDSVAATPGAPIVVDVLANDTDGDGDELTIVGFTVPSQGTVELVPGGLQYTAANGASGTDSFDYTITDGDSDASATVLVALGTTSTTTTTTTTTTSEPRPGNQAPRAVDDTAEVLEDEQTPIDVLGNDEDPNGDSIAIVALGQPTFGSVVLSDDTVVYTPPLDFNGLDSFQYTIADTAGLEAQATVSIGIAPQNDPPVAGNDEATAVEGDPGDPVEPGPTGEQGDPVTIAVLLNDTDVDGDVLVPRIVEPPTRGRAAVNEDGTITYSGDPGSAGTDAFTYVVNDGTVDSEVATVTITIFPVIGIQPGSIAVTEGQEPEQSFTLILRVRVPVAVEVTPSTPRGANDTATIDDDFEGYSDPTRVLEPGETRVTVGPPPILNDSEAELEESFTVEFTARYPGDVVTSVRGTVTIISNDEVD